MEAEDWNDKKTADRATVHSIERQWIWSRTGTLILMLNGREEDRTLRKRSMGLAGIDSDQLNRVGGRCVPAEWEAQTGLFCIWIGLGLFASPALMPLLSAT